MHTNALRELNRLAPSTGGAFGRAYESSKKDGGTADFKALRSELKDMGYKLEEKEREHTHEVFVTSEGEGLVAHGLSDTADDALLHAVWGAVREADAAAEAAKS